MTVGVVDALEVIDVQHQCAQRALLALAVGVQLLGMFEERPAVLQAGQLIGLRRAAGDVVRAFHLVGQA
ncbi:hypothetical protein D3C77_593980 [compost metagenome]